MLKIIITFLLFTVSSFTLSAQTQSWSWAKSISGQGIEQASKIATDRAGNVFITGLFASDEAKIGGIILKNHKKDWADMFVAKYDASGKLLWAKTAGGNKNDEGMDIATDSMGNVYVTGYFQSDTAYFDSVALKNNSEIFSDDLFLVKYDPSGKLVWAKTAGGRSEDKGMGIIINKKNEIFWTGTFGGDTFILGNDTVRATQRYSWNSSGTFIAKYDVNGNEKWVKQYEGAQVTNIVNLNSEGFCISGLIDSSIRFGNTVLVNPHYDKAWEIFIASMDNDGKVNWARQSSGECWCSSLAADKKGSIYLGGNNEGDSITFGNLKIEIAPLKTIGFIVKYNPDGNPVHIFQSTETFFGALATDNLCNFYAAGNFNYDSAVVESHEIRNSEKYDPLAGYSFCAFPEDFYIAGFDSSGKLISTKSFGGKGSDFCLDLKTDNDGNVYGCGSFCGHNLILGNDTLKPGLENDCFVGKIKSHNGGIEVLNLSENPFSIYPNPASGTIRIKAAVATGKSRILIYNMIGQVKLEQNFTSTPLGETIFDIGKISPGYYVAVIEQNGKRFVEKLVVE